VWRLDLHTSTWELVSANPSTQPAGDAGGAEPEAAEKQPLLPSGGPVSLGPLAGHTVTLCGARLLVLGGHVKVGWGLRISRVFCAPS
jgi:hypothetical protein